MNIQEVKYDIKYKCGGKIYYCRDKECKHFSLDTVMEDGVLKVDLKAKEKVTF